MFRKLLKAMIASVAGLGLAVALFSFPSPPRAAPCSDEWAASIERDCVRTGDREGHGPDRGDSEWYHVVERALRMEPLPTNEHDAHCRAVARQIAEHRYMRSRLLG
jgi:hypothetical protein